jgi:hypothetical protein
MIQDLKPEMPVIIKKIKSADDSLVPTPQMQDYNCGQDNGFVSLPVEYTLEGTLIGTIKIGERVKVNRTKRNGIVVNGQFTTSLVKSIDENTFCTENSVYHITVKQ